MMISMRGEGCAERVDEQRKGCHCVAGASRLEAGADSAPLREARPVGE